jgi:hypothetical protein
MTQEFLLTEDAWLDEIFSSEYGQTLKPEGYMKYKYLAEHTREYLDWVSKKLKSNKEFAFTLTTSITDKDKWPDLENAMCIAADKILNQQTCPVLAGAAYLEYQASGAPHVHGWYRCSGGHRIYQKIWKRYWPEWNEDKKLGKGHPGGYHQELKTNWYKGYASAEGRQIVKV